MLKNTGPLTYFIFSLNISAEFLFRIQVTLQTFLASFLEYQICILQLNYCKSRLTSPLNLGQIVRFQTPSLTYCALNLTKPETICGCGAWQGMRWGRLKPLRQVQRRQKWKCVGEGSESCHKALDAQPTSEWCGMWCTALWQLTPKLMPPINAKSLYQLPFQQSVAYFPAALHRYSLVERRNVCTRQTLLR